MSEARARAALLLVSTLLGAVTVEVGARAMDGDWAWRDRREAARVAFRAGLPADHHASLGWIPREGARGADNRWSVPVSVLRHGVRSNRPLEAGDPGDEPPTGGILAVGDSFTFGAQVGDADTWPARLAALTGEPVINAGVFAYGVDQIVLRAEALLDELRPRVLIASIIPDDIDRCELHTLQGAPKPWFSLHDGALKRHNDPVPPAPPGSPLGALLRPLGYSHAAHRLLMATAPDIWLQRAPVWRTQRAHRDGVAVACRLLQRLGDTADAAGVERRLLLIQHEQSLADEHLARADALARCLGDRWAIVDLRDGLRRARDEVPALFDSWFDSHMTPAGNAWVAARVHAALRP